MSDSKINPSLLRSLENHTALPSPARRRRKAIVDVLAWRGFSPCDVLIGEVEKQLTPGVFGTSPYTCLRNDMRALRKIGAAIGYSRARGTKGYYLELESLSEEIQTVIRHF